MEDIQSAVNRTYFRGGDTYTHRALAFTTRIMFNSRYGGRGGRTEEGGVAQILVVLTDGESRDGKKTVLEADKLKANGKSNPRIF